MSTFEGITKEYQRISIDRFDGNNLESTLFILSHFHSDHTVGLASESFKERILLNPEIKIYCTKITRNLILLEEVYNILKDAIVPLAENVPYQLDIPDVRNLDVNPDDKKEQITLTLLPAGHCLGSAMCLIEGSNGRVLYTGDYRISAKHFKQFQSIVQSDDHHKPLDSLYVDTTFFHPGNKFIPSRSYTLLCATEVIGHWINQGRSRVVNLKFKASLGCEHLLSAIGKHFNMKIHISNFKFNQCSNLGNVADHFTVEPDSTQIHACDLIRPSSGQKRQRRKRNSSLGDACSCEVIRSTKPEDLRTLTFSAMLFTGSGAPNRYCIPVGTSDYKICYSLHPSYNEVYQLIEMLKPKKAYANVERLGSRTPRDYDVQRELDRVVESVQHSSCRINNDGAEEMEKKQNGQFSEDSLDNYLFDETQSYLKSINNRHRLEGYDLTADILGLNDNPYSEMMDESSGSVTNPSRKRKREMSNDELPEDNSESSAKRITLERQVLQEHIRNHGSQVDGSCETMLLMTDEESGDNCDTEEENKLLDTTNSDLDGIHEDVILYSSPKVDSPKINCSFDDPCKTLSQSDSSCHAVGQSQESCRIVSQPEPSNHKVATSSKEDDEALLINLCNDDDEDCIEGRKECDFLMESDGTVELNSSLDASNVRAPSNSEDVVTSSSTRPTNCSTPTKILPPISTNCFVSSEGVVRTAAPPSILYQCDEEVAEGRSSNNVAHTSGQPVVCIDLTSDLDEEEDEEEDYDDEEDDYNQVKVPNLMQMSMRDRMVVDDGDERGYEGGDECDSSDYAEESKNFAVQHGCLMTVAVGGGRDDSNDRTSGYDSDVSHLTELHRKSHARFEKLYKRKQRKIKIKTRRQNLRSVAKDDVIVIDDDDSSDTEDSYDYDSGESSSDYDHYPGKGRGGARRDDSEQFLVPSVSSSSESSQTLSSEDNIVVVNCTKSAEEEEERGGVGGALEENKEAKKGDSVMIKPPPLSQNGEH